ncbi:hypothetical protein PHMEG_00041073, partial [Phytophthora megakarya]
MAYTPPVRETRSEHQRFVQRLRGRSASERARLQREHTAFLAGERDKDADFDDEPTRTPARSRPPLRPPTGKDVSYLRANLRMVSQERRAIAKKTLAGSGKKVVRVEKFADGDKDYLPYEDEDEGEDDELERKMKGQAKAKVPAKERSKTKPAANSVASKSKKPKELSASRVAKDQEKAAKVAKLQRLSLHLHEAMGATAKEKTWKKLFEIADAKKHHKKAKATPAKRKSTSAAETQRKKRVSVNRDARTETSAVSATSHTTCSQLWHYKWGMGRNAQTHA